MRIIILGGDGFCGWPAALYLSQRGHTVTVLDNFSRRAWDDELGTASLVPIAPLDRRVAAWQRRSGKRITTYTADLNQGERIHAIFAEFQPEVIVHFGEQRSAPYSMIDRDHAVFTQVNNVSGTLNVLWAMRAAVPDAHLIKLGTMGEYGTPNIAIEEGYLQVTHEGRTDVLPYPKQPGSFYHLSKVHDSHNILFACRTWGLRATDLNQGVVYGVATAETQLDPELATRYDYDHVFGTALNRFCAQAAYGVPLTVYGSGQQTRGFLDLRDTVRCIELAALSPPPAGEMRVMNQFTEQYSVGALAERVCALVRVRGMTCEITHLGNPRVEQEHHFYAAKHTALLSLGLEPHLLSNETLGCVLDAAMRHRERINPGLFLPTIHWR